MPATATTSPPSPPFRTSELSPVPAATMTLPPAPVRAEELPPRISTFAPFWLSLFPAAMDSLPADPPELSPDAIVTMPVESDSAEPERKIKVPEFPVRPAFAVAKNNSPLEVGEIPLRTYVEPP